MSRIVRIVTALTVPLGSRGVELGLVFACLFLTVLLVGRLVAGPEQSWRNLDRPYRTSNRWQRLWWRSIGLLVLAVLSVVTEPDWKTRFSRRPRPLAPVKR